MAEALDDKKLSYDQIAEVAVRWRGVEPNGEALPHNPNFMKPCAHCLKNSKISLVMGIEAPPAKDSPSF